MLGGGGADASAGTVPGDSPVDVVFAGVLVFDDPPDEPPLLDDPSLRDDPSDVNASPFEFEEPFEFDDEDDEDDDPLLAHAPSESTNTPSRAMSARRTARNLA